MSSKITKRIKTLISQMSISEKVGQLFMLAYTGKDIDYAKELISKYYVGGFYISNDNAQSHEEAFELTTSLNFEAQKRTCDAPLLIGVDQEGAWSVLSKTSITGPGNLALGSANDLALTHDIHQMFAKEMTCVGYNTVLGPCSDVNSNKNNPIIGVRAFGEQVEAVAKHVGAAVKGLQAGGAMSAAKHFPGHGDTSEDTHRKLPTVNKSLKQLNKEDLVPFKAAIEAGVDIIMTAHILYPQIDPQYPATLSSIILQDILRKKMGFKGIILTDSMNMWAMRKNYQPAEAAILAFKAGANIVMLSEEVYENSLGDYKQKQKDTILGVVDAVKAGDLDETVIDRSLALVLDYKYNNPAFSDVSKFDNSRFGSKSHLELAEKAAKQAVKIVRDDIGAWPIKHDSFYVVPTSNPVTQNKILECRGIGPNDDRLVTDVFIDGLYENKVNFKLVKYANIGAFLTDTNTNELPIILITENYPIAGYDHDVEAQAEIVNKMIDKFGDRVIVIGLRSDYELEQYVDLKTYICAYSSRPISAKVVAKMFEKGLGSFPST